MALCRVRMSKTIKSLRGSLQKAPGTKKNGRAFRSSASFCAVSTGEFQRLSLSHHPRPFVCFSPVIYISNYAIY